MRQCLIATTAALALLASHPTAAREHLLVLDPAASHVDFHLTATGHDVEGHFALRSGEVRFDPETGTATGEITIDATSGNTQNPKRDKTMHGKVLESAAFPAITFKAQRIDGQFAESGPSDITLHGVITLLGVEHPLDMPARIDIDGGHAHAVTRFPIPFVDWGLHDPSMMFLRVDHVVNLTVDAAGTVSSVPATPAPAPAAAPVSPGH